MPASTNRNRNTTTNAKTFDNATTNTNITPTALDKALANAIRRVCDQMSDTQFANAVALAGRLITKYVKEELKLD